MVEGCLEILPQEERELLVAYDDPVPGKLPKEVRARLSEKLGIPRSALAGWVFKIREKVQDCVRTKLHPPRLSFSFGADGGVDE